MSKSPEAPLSSPLSFRAEAAAEIEQSLVEIN